MWKYNDYITIDDPNDRLIRLRLHIQEVSNRIVAITSRAGDFTPVDPSYLKQLKAEEKELVNQKPGSRNYARNKGRFNHG